MSWNKDFFNLFYKNLFMSRTKEDIDFNVKLIKEITKRENGSVVDFCCGVGDILSGFKESGFDTYGVDFSEDYIKEANDFFKEKNVFHGDAITFDFNKKFDVALNWFSSFGYFDDIQNQKLLNNISKHVKEDGVFLLEIFSSYDIIRNFKEKIEYVKQYENKDVLIERVSDLDLKNRNLKQNWKFTTDEKVMHYETVNKLYMIDEIINKLNIAGFKKVRVLNHGNDLVLSDVDLNSKRIIFIGEK